MIHKKKNEKWIWEWERQMYPFIWWNIGMMYIHDRTFTPYPTETVFISRGTTAEMYFHRSSLERIALYFLKKIEKDGVFMSLFRNEVKREERYIKEFGKNMLQKDFSKLPNEALCTYLSQYSRLYRQHGVGVIRSVNRIGLEMLQNFFQKHYPLEEGLTLLKTLTRSTRKSEFQRAQDSMQGLAKMIARNPRWFRFFRNNTPKQIINALKKRNTLYQPLSSYLKRYGYLQCGYIDELPITYAQLIKNVRKEICSVKRNHTGDVVLPVSIARQSYPLPIRRLGTALSEFTYYKDHIRSYYNFLHYSTRELFEECASRLKVSLPELRMLTPDEIIDALKSGTFNKRTIVNRQKLCVIHCTAKKQEILTGKHARTFLKRELHFRNTKQMREIHGICAQKGHAVGTVKIIKKPEDFDGNNQNFILVTPMTTPELMPVAREALAIVTDEGGITCHAAIIAREMQKPCIIGTRIASRVFRDGDYVEVDASQGVIRLKHK
ncbi:MAG: PEP-utilizing enzyme [Patescibacteria group bacterium]